MIGACGWFGRAVMCAAVLVALPALAAGQDTPVPELRVGSGADTIDVDGQLNEAAWSTAPMSDAFAQTDPGEGLPPSFRTTVRVLAGRNELVIGIVCEDPQPGGIVSYSVRRDAGLGQEDSLKIVLGPFRDGRSGYVFAVNPRGARYDAVINAGAENENSDWDGIWQAATGRSETGWTAEIRIPIQTLSFNPSVREWHFNVERRIQRLLEIDRWASAVRQYRLTLTSRAGLITDLPDFALGRGLSVRPSLTAGGGVPAPSASLDGKFHPSLDVTQRLGANVTASFTTNTDFAETEVDTRQTNLTRFPLFFPEKRTFFLEGIDIFQFGPGVNNDMIPYFSRRMGLVGGREVPIIAGGKVNGRVAGTNFAAVITSTDSQPGVIDEGTTTGVVRIKRNLWRESYVGFLATAGDPLGRSGSWVSGVDFTYSTSGFLGDKNFSLNAYGIMTGRDGLGNDRTAAAFKIDYPNDKWDLRLWYRRIGRDFDPSLGFVPRRAMQRWNPAISNRTRFARGPIQDMSMGINPYITYSLHNQYEGLESPLTLAEPALSQRGAGPVHRDANRRSPEAAVRSIRGGGDRACSVPVGTAQRWLHDRAETPAVRVPELDHRIVLQRRPLAVGSDAGVESDRRCTHWSSRASATRAISPPAPSRNTCSAHDCGSMCRPTFRLPPTFSTTRTAIWWGSTRGCAGRSCPWPTCSSSTTTTSDRCWTDGSWIRTSCS